MYSNESILGDYFVGCLKVLGLVVFFLVSVSSAFAEGTLGKTDACLVTLYNYPAETPQYTVSAQASPKLPVFPKKSQRASKPDKNFHPPINLASQSPTEK